MNDAMSFSEMYTLSNVCIVTWTNAEVSIDHILDIIA